MPACWACQAEAGEGAFCHACGQIQPPRPRDPFTVFGLAPRYHLDTAALEKAWRELSKRLHPDKFAKAGARERRFSLEHSTQLNQAYKQLKDPTARAEWLLKAHGYSVATDEAGKPGAGGRLPLDFYEEVMEDREALLEAKDSGSPAPVESLARKVMERRDRTLADVDRAFSSWESSGRREDLAPAETELAKLRYYGRFLDEVEGKPHD